jgi:hypothetical protein
MTLEQQGGPMPSLGQEPKAQQPTTFPNGLTLADMLMRQELERKKQEWASWALEQYTKCKNARSPFERQWFINLAFVLGKQYISPISIAGVGNRLQVPKAPPWRVRVVVNKTRTAVRRECSKLTTSKPIPTVVPATNEDEDYTAATVGEQILKAEFANAQFEAEYRLWVWWGVVCGNSFMKQYYDPDELDYNSRAVPPPPTFPDGSPIPINLMEEISDALPEMDKLLNTPQPAKGKICIEKVNPFHIFVPDLLSESLEKQPYIIHEVAKSPLWVENKYKFKPQCDTRASGSILETATIVAKGGQEHLDGVRVKEIWIKPHGHVDFPKGGMLVVINDKVVHHADEWPYPFPEFPFYKFNGIPTGGFYSDSTVVDLIPLQKEYNKKRSQMIEIQNTMGKPKFFYQKGSLNPKMISSEPGQSIPYLPGYEAPVPIPGMEVPASFVQEIESLTQEFDDISGQHEISRGTTPTGVTSGTAIAYLQEQDDSMLNYQVASIENAVELIGKHHLEMVANYWDGQRLVRVTGTNNSYEALHWQKGMLKGNTDVRVQTGSALPFSKAAKIALITEFMQNGFIDVPSGLERLDFGGLDKIIEDSLVDKRQATRENLKMADLDDSMLKLLLEPAPGPGGVPPPEPVPDPMTGKPVQLNGDMTPFQPQPPIPVNTWDDHAAHIQYHNQFRKTQQFEVLSDLKKKAFELHVQLHEIAMSSQLVNAQGQPFRQPEVPVEQPVEEGNGPVEQPVQEESTPPQY